jgi:hypothetical protein
MIQEKPNIGQAWAQADVNRRVNLRFILLHQRICCMSPNGLERIASEVWVLSNDGHAQLLRFPG